MKTFSEFLNEGVYDPSIFKAIFMGGSPGSGKSHVRSKVCGGLGFTVLNTDDLVEYLLKKYNLPADKTKADDYEKEMWDIARKKAIHKTFDRRDMLMQNRTGIILDGTAFFTDRIAKHKWRLEELGYDTLMVFVVTGRKTAHERNKQRERVLEPHVIDDYHDEQDDIIRAYKKLFGKNLIIIRNEGDNTEYLDKVWKRIMKWAKRAPKRREAKEWISQELEKKKR